MTCWQTYLSYGAERRQQKRFLEEDRLRRRAKVRLLSLILTIFTKRVNFKIKAKQVKSYFTWYSMPSWDNNLKLALWRNHCSGWPVIESRVFLLRPRALTDLNWSAMLNLQSFMPIGTPLLCTPNQCIEKRRWHISNLTVNCVSLQIVTSVPLYQGWQNQLHRCRSPNSQFRAWCIMLEGTFNGTDLMMSPHLALKNLIVFFR